MPKLSAALAYARKHAILPIPLSWVKARPESTMPKLYGRWELWTINIALLVYLPGWGEFQRDKSIAELEPVMRWLTYDDRKVES